MGNEEATRLVNNAPHFKKWHESLMARPAVQSVMRNQDLSG